MCAQVRCPAAVLERYCVYLTVFDRASLPVLWGIRVPPAGLFLSAPLPHDGFYLVRLHPRAASVDG